MFTSVAQELPRLFAQDTCVIARSSFIDEPTAVKPTGGLKSITPQPLPGFPSIGGYNLCYFKPGSSLGLVSADENHAPVLAAFARVRAIADPAQVVRAVLEDAALWGGPLPAIPGFAEAVTKGFQEIRSRGMLAALEGALA